MFGLLSINQENLIIDRISAIFASTILDILSNKLDEVLTIIDENDWIYFSQGLVALICVKLIDHRNENETCNTTDLIARMPEGEQRDNAAFVLLDLFYQLQRRLPKNKVMELYRLVKPDQFALDYLELAVSLETYIDYLIYLLKIRQDTSDDMKDDIKNQLDKLLAKNHFSITLFDIGFILNYVKEKTDDKSMQLIQSIFQTNNTLQSKIKLELSRRNYNISSNEFSLIHDIIIHLYNSYLLYNINRLQYLTRILNSRYDRTSSYFLAWFKYFLCGTDEDWLIYKELTRQWTECFANDQKILYEILENIDSLIDLWTKASLNNNQESNFFVTYMVAQCFRQAKEQKRQNKLVENLIALAASMIEIKDTELINDTFNQPTRGTFIYAILFDESFSSLSVPNIIINRLSEQWTKW
ncbi:unnamed protein product [Rotaria sp. Silwood2]|nr:unnamed protein product [Rotaria sp. Silwood2]